jgi:hypothetical protein
LIFSRPPSKKKKKNDRWCCRTAIAAARPRLITINCELIVINLIKLNMASENKQGAGCRFGPMTWWHFYQENLILGKYYFYRLFS